ncbi:non-homologous end-joining DNA ligase [Desmospora activa]|uniref:DNA ligase (ATP) n=1 Tax=Desmospora activa DSM 45169 TaxID=1121389 RepID=A0A2T4ZA67_9BACL|nr:non-homologous end-joining DNA ligase [Desmospora activa]PTM58765.1 bifunctional non-homologous end joining protein LigD [Desmospora activa DSM 45169]
MFPIKPMEPIQTEAMLSSDEWIYQVKWDGVRILAYLEDGQVRLWNRKKAERTAQYPELVTELKGISCRSAVLDGEVIVVHRGRADFFQVLKRDLLQNPRKIQAAYQAIPVQFQLFDLLHINGEDLVKHAWEQRDEQLRLLLEKTQTERIAVTDSFADGNALWHATRERGWEGIVMKRKTSPYRVGQKHADWRKVKHFRTLMAHLVGASFKKGRVNALLLGVEEAGGWYYIGRAASGLSEQELTLLTEWIPQLQVASPAVVNPVYDPQVIWIRPSFSVKVRYLEWTPHGTLRSPTILGFNA